MVDSLLLNQVSNKDNLKTWFYDFCGLYMQIHILGFAWFALFLEPWNFLLHWRDLMFPNRHTVLSCNCSTEEVMDGVAAPLCCRASFAVFIHYFYVITLNEVKAQAKALSLDCAWCWIASMGMAQFWQQTFNTLGILWM